MGSGRRFVLLPVMLIAMVVGCGDSRPSDSLADLIRAGDHAGLAAALANGRDPNSIISGGLTPLMHAAARDDVRSIELLIEAGAGVDAQALEAMTALHVAASADAPGAVAALVGHGASLTLQSANGMAAVHHAATSGASDAIRAIADAGGDLNVASAATTQGHGYPRDVGPSALALAVRSGHDGVVEALLSHDVEVDNASERGITPLLMAVFADRPVETVAMLLEAGADPTVRVGCVEGCSVGEPLDALGWAVELQRLELVGILEG